MAETLETLFANAPRVPTFEQVFGTKAPRRVPMVCCVTGIRIRKGDNWTRYSLGDGYSVFALHKLSDTRKTALTALIPSASAGKAVKVKDADNG